MMLRFLAAVLLALAMAAPAAAQSVSGRFVDADGTPIPSARVMLQTDAGRVVHAVLTDGAGEFLLRAPAAGVYVLRAERIGYAASLSPPLALGEGEQASHRLVAGGGRVVLDAVVVSAQARCAPRPGASEQTAVVWGEVRKALDVVSATRHQLAPWAVELFQRETQRPSGVVTFESRRRVEGMAHRPFVTVDPERLATAGFVEAAGESMLYAAPDADVLLSDRFLEQHCFRLRSDGAPAPGLIGLAFEPVRGRRVPDVRGVLWVDRATAELRLLEYEYTRAPVRGPRGVPGGRMEFQRLADGRWITARWVIRMPVPLGREVVAVREVGGSVQPPDSVPLAAAPAPAEPRLAAEPPPAAAPAARPAAETPAVPDPAVQAPAPSTRREEAPAPNRPSDRRRLIDRREVERTTVGSAYQLVQSLRPQWLRGGDDSRIVVYVDGRRLGTLESLHSITHGDIDHVEYYDVVEAQQRWGVNHPQGAIHVVTRRR